MRTIFVTAVAAMLIPAGLAHAQAGATDLVRRITNQASHYDPTKENNNNPPPAQPQTPQHPAPQPTPNARPQPAQNAATLPPADPLAADQLANRLSAWIEYPAANGYKVKLYYAHPDYRSITVPPKLPALIVLQEWWGVNDDIQQRTRDLAAKGYYAVAVDLYDGHETKDPKQAAALKSNLTDEAALLRSKAGVDFLAFQAAAGIVDADHIGVIGWCMGGEQALKLAVADPRIKATAIFYGPLITDKTTLKHLGGPVLGVFGNDDQHPSPADVNAFETALKADGIASTIYRYDGVGHAFASPSAKTLGLYHEKEAADAFAKTYDWLATNLKPAQK